MRNGHQIQRQEIKAFARPASRPAFRIRLTGRQMRPTLVGCLKQFAILLTLLGFLNHFPAFANESMGTTTSGVKGEATVPIGATALFPSPNERFGFAPVRAPIESYDLSPFGAGWYHAWAADPDAPHPARMEAAHVVRVSPTGLTTSEMQIAQITQVDPGALWLIGNEPDMIRQDNVTPEQYAQQYHEAYFLIKRFDPNAQVAAGGIVQATPLRLGWLSAVWDAYLRRYGAPMPADAWQFHNYILQEVPDAWGAGIPPGYYGERGQTYPFNEHDSLAIFQEQVLAMREWMIDHGQRFKPLYLTEFGILFPEESGYDLARVERFFLDTTDWMLTANDPQLGYPADDNHLVQRWLWYSLDDVHFADGDNTVGALIDPDTRQTRPMGEVFVRQAKPLYRPYVNLTIARVTLTPVDGSRLSNQMAQTVNVQALVRNRGNVAVDHPFKALIEDHLGQVVYEEVLADMPARYEGDVVLRFTWQKPAGTDWSLRVRVDTGGEVAESDETDNARVARPEANLQLIALTIRNAQGAILASYGADVGQAVTIETQVEQLDGPRLAGVNVRFWDGDLLLHTEMLPGLTLGEKHTVSFRWESAAVGHHALSVDLVMPPGIDDPVPEGNRLGRDVLVSKARVFLPVLAGGSAGNGPAGLVCRNAVVNGSFETGAFAPWLASIYAGLADAACYDGKYCAALGRGLGIEDQLYQSVAIPAGASAHLNFAWAVVTSETVQEARDTLSVEIRSESGQLLDTILTLDNRNAHPVWLTSSLNLERYAGQTIRIHLHARNDHTNRTSFFVDDFVLEVCERQ